MKPSLAIIIVIIILAVAGVAYWAYAPKAQAPTTTASSTATTQNVVTYSCDSSKTINATYGTNSVKIVLSDGRTFNLPHVESGSGIRYEQGSGTAQDVQFSSEGDNAFLMENNVMTYSNCVAGTSSATTSGNVMLKSYTDQGKTFTFNYPNAFTLSGGGVGYTQDWMLNSTAMGLVLAKLTVPSSLQPKTNFNEATLTVGTSADATAVSQCLTNVNGLPSTKSTVTINGVQYTKIVYSDAAAGNRYDTTSYRTVRNNQCYVIEYTIHYGNIDNYPADSGIKAFNESQVQNLLEQVVQSFKFLS
jgi:membrane-bound inhibitor of C-type lysozyme